MLINFISYAHFVDKMWITYGLQRLKPVKLIYATDKNKALYVDFYVNFCGQSKCPI